jgi:ribosomal protein S11
MAYNFQPLQDVVNSWSEANIPDTIITFTDPKPNNIVLNAGGTEMLKVAEDGFYVRGTKVPVDDKEAATVYNAFKQFLVWAELNRM